ncbi:hypothetical protein M8C13_32045 [Crossiella sp. SN42]|uniref:hypothetical protein n=1 Tax=Crossiella sp. SN42 TaxID=2944808 RepID=UPI00207CEDAD|nr:hypothetical protein [Crossiella sp. SN42]MCO1580396.1 hypothetical protein [Crossiella sp. SN42]
MAGHAHPAEWFTADAGRSHGRQRLVCAGEPPKPRGVPGTSGASTVQSDRFRPPGERVALDVLQALRSPDRPPLTVLSGPAGIALAATAAHLRRLCADADRPGGFAHVRVVDLSFAASAAWSTLLELTPPASALRRDTSTLLIFKDLHRVPPEGLGAPSLLCESYDRYGQLDALLSRSWLRTLMRGHGVTVPGRQTTVAENERLLAVLVTEGLGTQQLATVLQASARSVEGRLSRLFQRSGYRSRVELATAMLTGHFSG